MQRTSRLSDSEMGKENHIEGHKTSDDGSATSEESAVIVWEAYYSEKHQREYFYNAVDKTVSWFAPSVKAENNSHDFAENQDEVKSEAFDLTSDEYPIEPIETSSNSYSKKWWEVVFLVVFLVVALVTVTRQIILIGLSLKQELLRQETQPLERELNIPSPVTHLPVAMINGNISQVHVGSDTHLASNLALLEVGADLRYDISVSWVLNDGMLSPIATSELSSMGQCLENDFFLDITDKAMETKREKEIK